MATGIVIYYTRSGNTKAMAQLIADAMNKAGLATQCKTVAETKVSDVLEADAIVVGSPTYYGRAASPIAAFFDETVNKHGKLDGKIGAAFASSAKINTMLIHGMIIQGDPQGDHYGPVSINKPDERVISQCTRRGKRIAELTLKLFK
jgi:NAD(P)H dehydrogenase (quinone)